MHTFHRETGTLLKFALSIPKKSVGQGRAGQGRAERAGKRAEVKRKCWKHRQTGSWVCVLVRVRMQVPDFFPSGVVAYGQASNTAVYTSGYPRACVRACTHTAWQANFALVNLGIIKMGNGRWAR